jgi:hypothetical protein
MCSNNHDNEDDLEKKSPAEDVQFHQQYYDMQCVRCDTCLCGDDTHTGVVMS